MESSIFLLLLLARQTGIFRTASLWSVRNFKKHVTHDTLTKRIQHDGYIFRVREQRIEKARKS